MVERVTVLQKRSFHFLIILTSHVASYRGGNQLNCVSERLTFLKVCKVPTASFSTIRSRCGEMFDNGSLSCYLTCLMGPSRRLLEIFATLTRGLNDRKWKRIRPMIATTSSPELFSTCVCRQWQPISAFGAGLSRQPTSTRAKVVNIGLRQCQHVTRCHSTTSDGRIPQDQQEDRPPKSQIGLFGHHVV
jgi:hypothetical protein